MSENPLSPNEAALLRAAPGSGEFGFEDLLDASGLSDAQAQSAAESMTARGYFEREETVAASLVLTDEGRSQAAVGVPELRIRAKLDRRVGNPRG